MSRHIGGGGGQQPCHQMSHGGGWGSKIGLKSVTYYLNGPFFFWTLNSLKQNTGGPRYPRVCYSWFWLFSDKFGGTFTCQTWSTNGPRSLGYIGVTQQADHDPLFSLKPVLCSIILVLFNSFILYICLRLNI